MLLSQLATYLIARNGQHLLVQNGLGDIGFNLTSLWTILEPEIDNFTAFCPPTKQFAISVYGSAYQYDFTTDVHNIGYDVSGPDPIYGEPPIDITSCLPVNSTAVYAAQALYRSGRADDISNPNRLVEPRVFVFEYRKPPQYPTAHLWVSETGHFDITASYANYEKRITSDTNGVITEVEVADIEKNKLYSGVLLKILSGRFLLSLARSRRAFTYNDLPVTTDASSLAQEGQKEYDDGIAQMISRHEWWTSIRP